MNLQPAGCKNFLCELNSYIFIYLSSPNKQLVLRLFRQQPEVRLPVIEALLGQVPSTTIEVKVFAFDIEVVEIFSAQSVAEWLGQGNQSLFSLFSNSKVSNVYHPPKSQKHQVEV